MFKAFSRKKILLAVSVLLIVGVGVFVLVRPGMAGVGFGFVASAWREAFGDSEGQEFAIDVSSASSSTIPESFSAWPPLIEKAKPAKSSAPISNADISKDLRVALDKAMVAAGFAVNSANDNASDSINAPQEIVSTPALRWCDLSAAEAGNPGVIFNEIAWMGSVDDPNDEWIEIKNISGREVDVKNWQILNRSGSIKIRVNAAAAMAAESLLLLERDKDYSGALVNAGDRLRLLDSNCGIVDEIDFSSGWPAGDNAAKRTMERDASANGWHTSANVGGSPDARNSEAVIPAAPDESAATSTAATSTAATSNPTQNIPTATSTPTSTQPVAGALTHLVIAAAQITGGEGLTNRDYIKVFNPTVGSVDISGWKLRKRTQSGAESSIKVFPEGSMISAGGYFTWANSENGFSAAISANVSSTQTLASDNSVALLDAENNIVDAVAWGSGHITPYIEGSAYPENPGANQQLTRKLEAGNMRDTGNNAGDFEGY